MPLFDFVCDTCGSVRVDALIQNADVLVPCAVDIEHGPMRRLPAAPAFAVKGFSAANNYSGGQTYHHKVPGKPNMRVEVKS